MTNPLKTRIYGEQVFIYQLMEIARSDEDSIKRIQELEAYLHSYSSKGKGRGKDAEPEGKGCWIVRVGVLEYQGDLYRIGGSCLLMVKRDHAQPIDPKALQASPLLHKESWPHFATQGWDIDDDARIIRLDTFVGSLFDVLIDPEVGPGPRAIRDMTGHNGNIIPRAHGRMETARMMTHANKGGHLID